MEEVDDVCSTSNLMSTYLYPIKMAVLIFPFLALVISLPIFAIAYHRNGSFARFRAFVIYTFVFYLLAAYFLIILPLPSRSAVAQLTTPRYNLVPFTFIREFLQTNTLNLLNVHTYRQGLLEPAIIQPLFNIFLTVPFGIYLRYFNKRWKKVLLFSFCLSLFFELTQLSGLYGIYVRPYRLFDVDDLLLNTTGGLLGFWVAPIILNLFPSRDKIRAQEAVLGSHVTYPRRFVAFLLDWLIFSILNGILTVIVRALGLPTTGTAASTILSLITLWLLFVLVPLWHQGSTIGKGVVHIKVVTSTGEKAGFWRLCWRVLWQYPAPLFLLSSILIAMENMAKNRGLNANNIDRFGLLFALFGGMLVIYGLHLLVNMIRNNPRLYYDYIAKTTEISTFKGAEEK